MATATLCVCDHCDLTVTLTDDELPEGWSDIRGTSWTAGPTPREIVFERFKDLPPDQQSIMMGSVELGAGELAGNDSEVMDKPSMIPSSWSVDLCTQCTTDFPTLAPEILKRAMAKQGLRKRHRARLARRH